MVRTRRAASSPIKHLVQSSGLWPRPHVSNCNIPTRLTLRMPLWSCAMANYSRSFIQLCECLRGSVLKHADWTSLLGLANQALTTPALIEIGDRLQRADT